MPSQRAKTSVDLSRLYERDLFEWSRRAAETLRGSQPDQADTDHLAEEIEDLGIRDLRALDSRVEVLLIHLRKGVDRLLKRNRSLRSRIKTDLAGNYEFAARRAAIRTGLPESLFPAECPFTVEQILDPEFLP